MKRPGRSATTNSIADILTEVCMAIAELKQRGIEIEADLDAALRQGRRLASRHARRRVDDFDAVDILDIITRRAIPWAARCPATEDFRRCHFALRQAWHALIAFRRANLD